MEHPRLRSDLVFQPHDDSVCVVKDPVRDRFYRLQAAERSIARRLDGKTSLESIRSSVEREFHASLSPEALSAFVAGLKQARLLETETARAGRARRRRRRWGSLLYLRLSLFDPDRWLGWLVRHFGWCFTRGFLIATATLIVLAGGVVLVNWEVLRVELPRLLRWDALVLVMGSVLAVSSAHEVAHGATCKRFGGEVHEMGLLLLYFQPAFYCNVTDAWMFPQKARRLWVAFAGPYFELFLWACAVLVWRLTDSETWLYHGALAVVATSGIKTLFNFNPLLKLDGYYLLSDWLELPNLRRRAFRHVGDSIKRLLGLDGESTDPLTRREHRILLVYGCVAAVLSIVVLGWVLVKLGGFLVARGYPELLLLPAGLVAWKFRGRFRRMFGRAAGAAEPEDPADDEAAPGPAPAAAPRESERPGKRKRRRIPRRLGVALLGGVGLVVLLWWGRWELKVTGPFVVLPLENADVRTEVDGSVEAVLVQEGDWVSAGQVIARLSDREHRNALLQAEAEIRQMEAQLRLLEAGPRPEEVQLARLDIARAEDRAKYARKHVDRDQRLLQEQLLSQRDFEATQQSLVEINNQVTEAKQRLELLLAGSRPEQIEATKAALARLETRRRYIAEELRHAGVCSPADGLVVTPNRALKELIGQVVPAGGLIAKVYELDSVEVQTTVSEKDIADIRVGQEVLLKARAYPERTFHGRVTFIGTTVQAGSAEGATGISAGLKPPATPATGSVVVTTRITNEAMLLKPGMSGVVKISCGDRSLLQLAARRVARTLKVEFWSWW
jgi:multidrug resistance efflux pump